MTADTAFHDPEVEACDAIRSALEDLDPAARSRVLRWAGARHGVPLIERPRRHVPSSRQAVIEERSSRGRSVGYRPDRVLTAEKLAAEFGMTSAWAYKHRAELGVRRAEPGSSAKWEFLSAGVARALASNPDVHPAELPPSWAEAAEALRSGNSAEPVADGLREH